eukprot:176863_1
MEKVARIYEENREKVPELAKECVTFFTSWIMSPFFSGVYPLDLSLVTYNFVFAIVSFQSSQRDRSEIATETIPGVTPLCCPNGHRIRPIGGVLAGYGCKCDGRHRPGGCLSGMTTLMRSTDGAVLYHCSECTYYLCQRCFVRALRVQNNKRAGAIVMFNFAYTWYQADLDRKPEFQKILKLINLESMTVKELVTDVYDKQVIPADTLIKALKRIVTDEEPKPRSLFSGSSNSALFGKFATHKISNLQASSKTSFQKINFGILLDERCADDVRFAVGSVGKIFGANRGILAVRSAVFDAMLFGRMLESSDDATIQIPDVEPDVFEAMLRFIYTGQLVVSAEIYPGMMYAIDKYLISDAQPLLLSALAGILTAHTAVGLLNGVRGKFEAATEKIVSFIWSKTRMWWAEFASGLDLKSWEHLLDPKQIRDEPWIFAQIVKCGVKMEKSEISNLVKKLDFRKLSVPFISKEVRASGVFSDDELFEILANRNIPDIQAVTGTMNIPFKAKVSEPDKQGRMQVFASISATV